MAKCVKVTLAEYEYLLETVQNDNLTIAKLVAELTRAKEDIKRLLILGGNAACEFCACKPAMCECCENDAKWRGWSLRGAANEPRQEQVRQPESDG